MASLRSPSIAAQPLTRSAVPVATAAPQRQLHLVILFIARPILRDKQNPIYCHRRQGQHNLFMQLGTKLQKKKKGKKENLMIKAT